MRRKTSRTRVVVSRLLIILLGMYLLTLATGRPLRALAVELIGVIASWAPPRLGLAPCLIQEPERPRGVIGSGERFSAGTND
jgi:hypothetical protein